MKYMMEVLFYMYMHCFNVGSTKVYGYSGLPYAVPIHMDHVGCDGSEMTLLSCPYDSPNCDHTSDAFVSCQRELWYHFLCNNLNRIYHDFNP